MRYPRAFNVYWHRQKDKFPSTISTWMLKRIREVTYGAWKAGRYYEAPDYDPTPEEEGEPPITMAERQVAPR